MTAPTTAVVRLHANRPGVGLELRDDLVRGDWVRVCEAPCNRAIVVEGREARVNGPGITPSNVFRIEPGFGTARFEVRAGSARSRRIGTVLLAAGLPTTAAGFAGYGYGEMQDLAALRIAGVAALGIGGAAVVTSFVFVSRGGTRVRDSRGRRIANATVAPRF